MPEIDYSQEWLTVNAPGRAELLGNHTDYNQGLILSLAINRYITFRSIKRNDRILKITAQDADGDKTWQGSLDNLTPQSKNTWVNYIIGVIAYLEENDHKLRGIEITFKNNIPVGAGLSSSAALEAATLLTCQKHFPFQMTAMEMAQACQWAEHHYAGVMCGLLDQMSVLSSHENHINYIDFQNFSMQKITFPDSYSFVIVNSGISHALVDGGYNERRQSCEEAAAILGKPSLRHVSLEELAAAKDKLPELPYKRACHIVQENDRVTRALEHITNHQIEQFGEILFASHQSSIDNFENSCPELDTLVEFSKNHPACLGARLSGGGFGGATINLVHKEQTNDFAIAISEHYKSKYAQTPLTIVTQPAPGAAHFIN
ncbi:MAG: galactokinase [Verrucomicrobiota bacterium]